MDEKTQTTTALYENHGPSKEALDLQSPNKEKKDVAEFLGISIRMVEKLMAEGGLPFYRLGTRRVRFRLADVMEWMESNNKVY
jgi:excisionase family DNA binding protein